MTLTEKQEYNKRCAEFLGYKIIVDDLYDGAITVQEGCNNPSFLHDRMPDERWCVYPRFDSDWNWIMEVVEKIEKLDYWVCIQNTYVGIGKRNDEQPVIGYSYSSLTITKKEAIVSTIDKFLIWYKTI